MATTNVTMMSVKSLTTTESDIEVENFLVFRIIDPWGFQDGPNPTPPYVYILIEVGYIVLFVIVTYLMRKYNFMKVISQHSCNILLHKSNDSRQTMTQLQNTIVAILK